MNFGSTVAATDGDNDGAIAFATIPFACLYLGSSIRRLSFSDVLVGAAIDAECAAAAAEEEDGDDDM